MAKNLLFAFRGPYFLIPGRQDGSRDPHVNSVEPSKWRKIFYFFVTIIVFPSRQPAENNCAPRREKYHHFFSLLMRKAVCFADTAAPNRVQIYLDYSHACAHLCRFFPQLALTGLGGF
jgi:hypothetical protein